MKGWRTTSTVEFDHNRISAVSWSSQYSIVLSWDLLGLTTMKSRIPSFFTNFITTPVLSGPLYIIPDMYHTQVTEYLLEKLNE